MSIREDKDLKVPPQLQRAMLAAGGGEVCPGAHIDPRSEPTFPERERQPLEARARWGFQLAAGWGFKEGQCKPERKKRGEERNIRGERLQCFDSLSGRQWRAPLERSKGLAEPAHRASRSFRKQCQRGNRPWIERSGAAAGQSNL